MQQNQREQSLHAPLETALEQPSATEVARQQTAVVAAVGTRAASSHSAAQAHCSGPVFLLPGLEMPALPCPAPPRPSTITAMSKPAENQQHLGLSSQA
jgi:hypothetical protein